MQKIKNVSLSNGFEEKINLSFIETFNIEISITKKEMISLLNLYRKSFLFDKYFLTSGKYLSIIGYAFLYVYCLLNHIYIYINIVHASMRLCIKTCSYFIIPTIPLEQNFPVHYVRQIKL